MFVNRISNVSNIKFRGYQHLKNSVGDDVTRFNVPFDSDNETCQIAFYRVKTDSKYNHTIIPESKVLVDVPKEGAEVNVPKLLSLEKNEPYQYQIILTDDKGNQRCVADTGMQERHGDEIYNHVSTRTTQPIVNGAACLIMPDSFNIGAKYRPFNDPNTGEIFYDSELQRSAEKKIRNFSNVFGYSTF